MLMSRLADGLIVRQARAGRRFGRTGLSPQLQHFVEKQLGDCLILTHERKAHAQIGLSLIIFRVGHLLTSRRFQTQLGRVAGVPKLQLFSLP